MSRTDRSVALLLHDGLTFTRQPLTHEQTGDLLEGLRLLAIAAL